MAESDLAPAEGTPEEAPVANEPQFGFDDTDQPPADPEPESGQPEEASPEEPSEDDLAAFRRQQDYTRKTMDLADERRTFEAERTQWRQEMQQQREQLQQLLQETQQPSGLTGMAGSLQQKLADPNLTPDQRLAVQEELRGVEYVRGLESELAQLKATVENLQPEFQQTSRTVQSLQQMQQQQTLASVQRQHSEAVKQFGEETVQQAMPMVRRLAVVNGQWEPEINGKTGQPYTFAEMVAIVTGKPAESQSRAQTASKNGRTQAKKTASTVGAQAGETARTSLTEAEVLQEIEATLQA